MWLQRQLTEDDDLSEFRWGVDSLDEWLRDHAARSHAQGITRVHVLVDESNPSVVVGYAAIQPTQVAARGLTRAVAGGHRVVPGYLVARLALHTDLQGQGLGAQLLPGTLELCVNAAAIGGARVIVVDPIDASAADFYMRFGFSPTKGPEGRLVVKVASAAAVIGA